MESTKQQQQQQQQMMAEHPTENDDNDQASEYKAFNPMSGNLGLNQCWSSDPLGMYMMAFSFSK